MIINLLALIPYGEISLKGAEDIFDATIEELHRGEASPDWPATLGFSKYEATAYLHGATLADLVRLRYEGWPTSCCRCHLSLDYRLYGWWFEHSDDGVPRIRHIECPIITFGEGNELLPS